MFFLKKEKTIGSHDTYLEGRTALLALRGLRLPRLLQRRQAVAEHVLLVTVRLDLLGDFLLLVQQLPAAGPARVRVRTPAMRAARINGSMDEKTREKTMTKA